MIDGKTSKDFNKLVVAEEVNEETLKFGLSILHARIRFFESLLHLAFKLPLKKWQARTAEEKKIVKETKEKIKKKFKEEMGLLVDISKSGVGNTNDDPYLSCNRPKQHKKSKPFSMEAINLMVASTPNLPPNKNDSDECIEEDEEHEDEQLESDY
ncbi:unnamed protein product [Euphydryas editha]|uniref:Uncharacterized protein n=1 Tax=Euphydryas editha TaxID=104508 RepID=A0AAU9VED8_EUPED|nr:unnamed protein product [Euphydryas editha]